MSSLTFTYAVLSGDSATSHWWWSSTTFTRWVHPLASSVALLIKSSLWIDSDFSRVSQKSVTNSNQSETTSNHQHFLVLSRTSSCNGRPLASPHCQSRKSCWVFSTSYNQISPTPITNLDTIICNLHYSLWLLFLRIADLLIQANPYSCVYVCVLSLLSFIPIITTTVAIIDPWLSVFVPRTCQCPTTCYHVPRLYFAQVPKTSPLHSGGLVLHQASVAPRGFRAIGHRRHGGISSSCCWWIQMSMSHQELSILPFEELVLHLRLPRARH